MTVTTRDGKVTEELTDAMAAPIREEPDTPAAHGLFSPPTGQDTGRGATMIEAINQALLEEMERDPRVFILGEDIGPRGGVFGATRGLIERFGEARILDTPIAESGFTGFGIGAAMLGMIPIIEIQFADFIMPALDQIISEMAKLH